MADEPDGEYPRKSERAKSANPTSPSRCASPASSKRSLSPSTKDAAIADRRQAGNLAVAGRKRIGQRMDLAVDLRDYVTGRRDSKRERDLLRRVRALPQAQRAEVLLPLLDLNPRVALVLVNRAQLSLASYLTVFKQGLIKGDASSVKWWMEATVPHLGWRRVFSVLRGALADNPGRGASALYHVPLLCRHNAPQPALSGPLPTAALALEFHQLVVLYQESGHTVCDESSFKRIKDALRDRNFHACDSEEPSLAPRSARRNSAP
jgi:hypothetical protein